jgi:hypothetical protein
MKRPEKIVKWLSVDKKLNEPFIDHNGKPDYNYTVHIPYWLAKAYNPFWVKVEIRAKNPCYADKIKEENKAETDAYLKANWRKKIDKHYKMNNGFLLVSTKAMGAGWFKSMEDYNNYHKELQELNRKYLRALEDCPSLSEKNRPSEGETVGGPVCPEPKEVPSVIGTTATAPDSISENQSTEVNKK